MVNDSVFGPLHELTPVLEKMESKNTDAFGMVEVATPITATYNRGLSVCEKAYFYINGSINL